MRFRGKKKLIKFSLLSFLSVHVLFAANWFPIYDDAFMANINDACFSSSGYSTIYAVGQGGAFYETNDGGYSWQTVNVGIADNLLSVLSVVDWSQETPVILAAGENGSLVRYRADTQIWEPLGFPGEFHNRALCMDYMSGTTIWVGGDNGQLYSTRDWGQTWIPSPLLVDPGYSIKSIVRVNEGLFLFAEAADGSTNLLGESEVTFTPVASFPNASFVGSSPLEGDGVMDMFFALFNSLTQQTEIYYRLEYTTAELVHSSDMGIPTDFAVSGNPFGSGAMWVTSDGGTIFESQDGGVTWEDIYRDPQARRLGPVLTIGGYFGSEIENRIFGDNGLVLKYGFEPLYFWPAINDIVPSDFDHIEIKFSSVPDLNSVQQGVQILSDQRGGVPFIAEYAPEDSYLVYLQIQGIFGPAQVPGEYWNISVSETIGEENDLTSGIPVGFNYDITLTSPLATSFNYSDFYQGTTIVSRPTTNWVSGFINQDDNLDFLTWDGDSLLCFMGMNSGGFESPVGIDLLNMYVAIDGSIENQLVLEDIDKDGLPDLILFNDTYADFCRNISTNADILFSPAVNFTETSGLQAIVPYDANNNGITDLIVYASELSTYSDFDGGSYTYISHEPTNYYDLLGLEMADINGDGIQDMVLATWPAESQPYLSFRLGLGNGIFDTDFEYNISLAGFSGLKTADLDNDGRLEILVADDTQIFVFSLTDPALQEIWNFNQITIIDHPAQIVDFYVQDFGGDRIDDSNIGLDVTVLSETGIVFYENTTPDVGLFQFDYVPGLSRPVSETTYNQLLIGDWDKNAELDIAVVDNQIGRIKIWNKFDWTPVIENWDVQNQQVILNWEAFPAEFGDLDYYIVWRNFQVKPWTLPWPLLPIERTSLTNTFNDEEIGKYNTYSYKVQAVFNGGSTTLWSDPVTIDTYFELNGPQMGVLSDTTRPYLAATSIRVGPDSSLEIGPGVEMAFLPATRFDVYGNLLVSGNNMTEMVELKLKPAYEDSSAWFGITLHPAADTVKFNWFSISGAQEGIGAYTRPLEMEMGGISNCQTAILCTNDSASIHNVLVDSNYFGIMLNGTARANIKNVTILSSMSNSITARDDARANIRNAIIWDNVNPVDIQGNASVRVAYSTADSLHPLVETFELSKLEPVIIPVVNDPPEIGVLSPTIDAGDPNDDFSEELMPNGGRINQGLFGGTMFATPSLQPRIEIAPKFIYMETRTRTSDTTQFVIRNKGWVDLDVFIPIEVGDLNYNPFRVWDQERLYVIPPGDSISVSVSFSPLDTLLFSDTLIIECNDPHVPEGIQPYYLTGQGTTKIPVVKLAPFPETRITESAVRFWLNVVDSGDVISQPSELDSYRLHYQLYSFADEDTIISIDTTAADHIDIYPLKDGFYFFKIWAYYIGDNISDDSFAKTQLINIQSAVRKPLRFRWYLASFPRSYPTEWRWFDQGDSSAYIVKWNNSTEEYTPLNNETIMPGQGFWMFPIKTMSLDMEQVDVVQPLDDVSIESLELKKGWNQVGAPTGYSLFWHEMKFTVGVSPTEIDFIDAVDDELTNGVIYQFVQTADFQGYDWNIVDSTTRAIPWQGYWIKVTEPCFLKFPENPAFEKTNIQISDVAKNKILPKTETGWQVNISLENSNYRDAKNVLGIGSPDDIQVMEPPHIGDFCSFYIPSENGNLTQKILSEFENYDDVKTWNILISSRNPGIVHTLTWDRDVLLNNDVYLYLVDEEKEAVVNMTELEIFSFTPNNKTKSFKIYATQDASFKPEIVPLNFTLKQNYPNPFNPQTTIRFGIPESADGSKTTIAVYDILGKKVALLFDGELNMGYHQFIWDGNNLAGEKVASGVYFYRLINGKTSLINKMVLVR